MGTGVILERTSNATSYGVQLAVYARAVKMRTSHQTMNRPFGSMR
jgi:ribosomal protein S26